MMSSEEDTDCLVMQEKLLKKGKRTRQRVDAGEPRNSYASIPNFSSRPQLHLGANNGYGLLQPCPTQLGGVNANGALAAGLMLGEAGGCVAANNNNNNLGDKGLLSVQVGGPSTPLGNGDHNLRHHLTSNSPGRHPSHHHHHHHHQRHHHSHNLALHHQSGGEGGSVDMGSDSEGQTGRNHGKNETCSMNGTAGLKEGEVAPHQRNHSPGAIPGATAADESSQLLREILQNGGCVTGNGKAAAKNGQHLGGSGTPGGVIAATTEINGSYGGRAASGGTMPTGGGGGNSPPSSMPAYLLPNGRNNNNLTNSAGSIISHLLKNTLSASAINNGLGATKDERVEEEEEMMEDEEEEDGDDDDLEEEEERVVGDGVCVAGTLVQGSSDSEHEDMDRKPDAGATLEVRSKMNGGGDDERSALDSPTSPDSAIIDDDDDDPKADSDSITFVKPSTSSTSSSSSLTSDTTTTTAPSGAPLTSSSSSAASNISTSSAQSLIPPPAPTNVDLKRARVENIISTMRSSPSRTSQPEMPQVNGCKKRKLYMPQQHESRMVMLATSSTDRSPPPHHHLESLDEDVMPVAPKQRRTHQDRLRHQLSQMQAQIAAIQQKLDLYDTHSSDSDMAAGESSPQSDDEQCELMTQQTEMAADAGSGGGSERVSRSGSVSGVATAPSGAAAAVATAAGNPNNPFFFHLGYGATIGRDERVGGPGGKSPPADLEPAHFIDEARRLVNEQERLAKEAESCKSAAVSASTLAEPKVAATAAAAAAAVAAAAGPVPKKPFAVVPPDWESLADTLKAGMSSLIDEWVKRCSANKPSGVSHACNVGDTPSRRDSSPLPMAASTPVAKMIHNSCSVVTTAPSTPSQMAAPVHAAASSSSSISTMSMSSVSTALSSSNSLLHLADRRSPRTKVIDRGRLGGLLGSSPGSAGMGPTNANVAAAVSAALFSSASNHFGDLHLKSPVAGLFQPPKPPMPLYVPHPQPQPPQPLAFYGAPHHHGGAESPEQSEALPLVVTTKKKRHKVTDTRITPRTVSRLLGQQEAMVESSVGHKYSLVGGGASPVEGSYHHPPPIVPVSLPTSVAIPNPSLHQSDVFSPYPYYHQPHHPRSSPQSDSVDEANLFHPAHPHHHALHSSLMMGQSSPDNIHMSSHMKTENGDSSDCNSGEMMFDSSLPTSSTLTPMHLRKAKLMFFYVRYPSSAILKTYFPDIKFNKNNTAQLVKWFSNFREFYYIQMEKYARQALSEGCKNGEDLTVTLDSELYRVLNLHYNRNNHIEVPTNFRYVVEQTLREFFKSIVAGKDTEQSWKKSIYKVIARMDDNLPDYFKSPNFLEQLE